MSVVVQLALQRRLPRQSVRKRLPNQGRNTLNSSDLGIISGEIVGTLGLCRRQALTQRNPKHLQVVSIRVVSQPSSIPLVATHLLLHCQKLLLSSDYPLLQISHSVLRNTLLTKPVKA